MERNTKDGTNSHMHANRYTYTHTHTRTHTHTHTPTHQPTHTNITVHTKRLAPEFIIVRAVKQKHFSGHAVNEYFMSSCFNL